MVWGDVQQNCNVSAELIHVVELEAAQLYNIVIIFFAFRNLECQTSSYVACQPYVVTGILKDVIDEACGCGFAVCSGYSENRLFRLYHVNDILQFQNWFFTIL